MIVNCRPYQRPFRVPLQTAHGAWSVRQGMILRLEDPQGRVGFGEVAPLPWFGSETCEAALGFCQDFVGRQAVAVLDQVPPTLPACQFAVETAWAELQASREPTSFGSPLGKSGGRSNLAPMGDPPVCGLLPAGPAVLNAWRPLWAAGYRTFKWKIGVYSVAQEWQWLRQLGEMWKANGLETVQLRLDANGGLTLAEARQWLEGCDRLGQDHPWIEFLEQPLPPTCPDLLLALSRDYQTPLALDESVATLTQLQRWHQRGWPGIYVIKGAIAGSPRQLLATIQRHHLDVVWSSALETGIGRRAVLALAGAQGQGSLAPETPATSPVKPQRAVGFGTGHWFVDNWDTLTAAALWDVI